MSTERLTRREALVRGAGAIVVGGAAAAGAWWLHDPTGQREVAERPTWRMPNFFERVECGVTSPRLSVATGSEERIEQMVRAAVGGLDAAVGMKRFVQAGDVVLIKPNVGFDRPPQHGATAHPEVVRAVVRLCREAGAAEVLITDNPIESPAACFARSGIGAVAEAEEARIVWPAGDGFAAVDGRERVPGAAVCSVLGGWPVLCEPLRRATKLIGVAPVKDHNLCGASMNLKNWYGLLGGRRNQLHQSIHATISDLALLFCPTLVIADATRVMMCSGPTGGRLSDVRPGGELGRPAVVAAVDPVACDAWCYEKLLGRDPAQLAYLELARRKIQTEIKANVWRFGEWHWPSYESQGLIAQTSV